MLNLHEKKRRQEQESRPLMELLPWMFPLTDDIVCCKDSGLLACFTFTGLDVDAATVEQMDQAIHDNIDAMRRMGTRPITVWWQARKRRIRYYPRGEYSSPWTKQIEEELAANYLNGKNYQITHTLSVLMMPAVGMDRIIDRLRLHLAGGNMGFLKALIETGQSLLSDSAAFAYTEQELGFALGQFEGLLKEFARSFTDIRFEQMTGESLMGFLKSSASPVRQNRVRMPGSDWLLDAYLCDAAVVPGDDFIYLDAGGQKRSQFVSAITVKNSGQGWPDSVGTGHLNKVLTAPGEVTVSHCFRLMPKGVAYRLAEKVRNYNALRKYSWKAYARAASNGGSFDDAPVDAGRQTMEKDAQEVLGKLTTDAWSKGWYNLTVLCHADSRDALDQLTDATTEILSNARFVVLREGIGVTSAFAGTIPGQWAEIVRWQTINTENLGCLVPFATIATGNPLNPYLTEHLKQSCPALAAFPTEYGVPLFINLHDGQLGHTMLIGPSRSGKTLLGMLLASLFTKYPNARVVIPDKDLSARIGTRIQGGVHYDLGRDPTNRVPQNPLVLLSDPKHLGWLAYFVEMLVSFRGHEVTAVERTDIDRALKATALLSKPNWRLSSVWASLSSQAVKVALAPWVGEGSLAHFFDNEEDRVDFEAVITAMETGQILLNEDVCGPFLEYQFYRIDNDMLERKEAGIEGPMMIYLPELWALLKNRLFAAKLDDWLRTMAKRMVLLMMDTQDPDGLAKSDVWPVLRDNIATSIYTPNRRAAGAELKQLYITKFQLTEEQVDIIVRGRRMHDYLYVQQGLSRKFGLEVGATALAVLRSETAAQISFNRHEASGRSTWVEDYIAEMKGMRWATEEEIELA